MTAAIRPPLRYPGGKARIAHEIVRHLPAHETYIEPFFGAGSVLFAKPAARVEIINDLDARVVNFFTVLRDRPDDLARAIDLTPFARDEFDLSAEETGDPVEDARRFAARCWMAFGVKIGSGSGFDRSGPTRGRSAVRLWRDVPDRVLSLVDRLRHVLIEHQPALDLIRYWSSSDALIYVDPPYLLSTLSSDRLYRHEMTEQDHCELLDTLDLHPGPVVLSGYRCPLYDERLLGWRRIDMPARAYLNARRVESIWLNRIAAAGVAQRPLEGMH